MGTSRVLGKASANRPLLSPSSFSALPVKEIGLSPDGGSGHSAGGRRGRVEAGEAEAGLVRAGVAGGRRPFNPVFPSLPSRAEGGDWIAPLSPSTPPQNLASFLGPLSSQVEPLKRGRRGVHSRRPTTANPPTLLPSFLSPSPPAPPTTSHPAWLSPAPRGRHVILRKQA